MSSETEPLSIWSAEAIRFTVFYLEGEQEVSSSIWWKTITGETPAEEAQKAKERQAIAVGPFGTGMLTVERQPLRLDIQLQAHPEHSPQTDGWYVLGPFESESQSFVKAVTGLFNLAPFPAVVRIAYGAVLLHPASDKVSGYQFLESYLHAVQIDAEDSRELLYRINRRRPSQLGIPNLLINRVNLWSVIKKQSVVMMGDKPRRISDAFADRLELDINTHPEFSGCLPKDRLPELLGELAGMAEEIACKGDTR